ncbi:MAG: M24B family metallopeptidase, partial [Acidocella sp.]|nr:M24B family metallopeptidase [Acidocella sp.]
MTSEHNARLTALRASIAARGLDGFLIPRADEHLGEYVPEAAERLAYISGFTGSAGLAIVLTTKAAIFSDGRYTLQLAQQTDAALWERLHMIEEKPEDWLARHAAGLKIGYDPWLISAEALARYGAIDMVPVTENPVDEIWANRSAAPMAPARPHGDAYAGESAADKRSRLAAALAAAAQDAAIISDPAALAWLFNIRGADVEFTPLALGCGLLFQDGTATLFMDAVKLPTETRAHLGNEVSIADRASLAPALAALAGKTVRYDPATMPVWFKMQLEAAGAKIAQAADLVAMPRALKNQVEQDGARAAHLRDGVAMARFLAWLSQAAPTGRESEMSAAAMLLSMRARGDLFRGESFPAISGAGEHGAIIHYSADPQSNRAIKPNEVYLIDSGGQYQDGTTDITRTIWTGPNLAPAEIRAHVTRVLAGHIALSQAVFPEGVAGAHLDVLARNALWQAGLDYDHGTGHGVGSYLSVHEGPAGISRAGKPVALAPGMVLSNEPGYYLNGAYVIRMENLMLVQQADF